MQAQLVYKFGRSVIDSVNLARRARQVWRTHFTVLH